MKKYNEKVIDKNKVIESQKEEINELKNKNNDYELNLDVKNNKYELKFSKNQKVQKNIDDYAENGKLLNKNHKKISDHELNSKKHND